MLTRIKRLCVVTVAVLALSLFAGLPAASARQVDAASGATRTGSVASSPVQVDYWLAPSCVYRFSHTHTFSKHVHLQNNCDDPNNEGEWVKVIIAYGPDSGCIHLAEGATATHSWSVGWPYAMSRLDRVESC